MEESLQIEENKEMWEAIYGITGGNFAWFRSKGLLEAEENYC